MTHYIFDKKKWRQHCCICHNIDTKIPSKDTPIGVSANTLKPCKEYKGCIDNFMDHITGEDTDRFFPERRSKRKDLFPVKTKRKRISFHKEIGLDESDKITDDILNRIKRSSAGDVVTIGKKQVRITKHMKQVAVWKLNLRKIKKRCVCK